MATIQRLVVSNCLSALRVLFVVIFATASSMSADEAPLSKPQITLRQTEQGGTFFEVTGLPAAALARFANREAGDAARTDLFSVHVVRTEGGAADRPALLGKSSVHKNLLRFNPRFPLEPGLTYRAVVAFDVSPAGDAAPNPLIRDFAIPRPDQPPTVVAAVYPTRATLPENQLKFYLHFSAPMSRGESYSHIRLLRDDGTEVEMPFLELGEELWNDDGTRLTVFFDPGRIKRGLKPREELGPSLEAGRSYVLAIDAGWLDAAGRPLAKGYRKAFKAGQPDETQPSPKRWTVTAPENVDAPLTLMFDEPLDHAMLQRIEIRDGDERTIEGRIEVDRHETRWRFTPQSRWVPGNYQIVVSTALEDQAGNSIGRPFEVDVFDTVERTAASATVTIPFRVDRP